MFFDPVFSEKEVKDALIKNGYVEGSDAYHSEWDRCFTPIYNTRKSVWGETGQVIKKVN